MHDDEELTSYYFISIRNWHHYIQALLHVVVDEVLEQHLVDVGAVG